MERYMRIGDAAAALNVSIETIRRYERAGRIAPAVRNAVGQRLYSEQDLQAIRQVLVPLRKDA
jgi:DNA-binding transcriptional MerR regulator